MRRILFCNIGWAEKYDGSVSDKPTGDGQYLKEGGVGHEIVNFVPSGDYYYGFVETKSVQRQARRITIENIDSIAKNSDSIDNVLVVWCATNKKKGGKFIVGWYENAIVYRNRQKPPFDSKRYELFVKGILETPEYMIKCGKGNAVLIEPDKRDFYVPTARQDGFGFGQSYLWYPANYDTLEVKEYIEKVLEYIKKNS